MKSIDDVLKAIEIESEQAPHISESKQETVEEDSEKKEKPKTEDFEINEQVLHFLDRLLNLLVIRKFFLNLETSGEYQNYRQCVNLFM